MHGKKQLFVRKGGRRSEAADLSVQHWLGKIVIGTAMKGKLKQDYGLCQTGPMLPNRRWTVLALRYFYHEAKVPEGLDRIGSHQGSLYDLFLQPLDVAVKKLRGRIAPGFRKEKTALPPKAAKKN